MARIEDFEQLRNRDQALTAALAELDQVFCGQVKFTKIDRPFTEADWDHIHTQNAIQRDQNKCLVMAAAASLNELLPDHCLSGLKFSDEAIKALTIAKTALQIAIDQITRPPVPIRRV